MTGGAASQLPRMNGRIGFGVRRPCRRFHTPRPRRGGRTPSTLGCGRHGRPRESGGRGAALQNSPLIPFAPVKKKRIRSRCTGNAARSQMAEAIANAFHGDVMDAVSAGSRPAGWVHPLAVKAMAEKGVDIRDATSKGADGFINQKFDVVVTVCDSAAAD